MIKYCDILLGLVSFSKLMLLIKPQMTLKLFFPLPKLFHKPTKLGIGFNVFSLSVVKSNVILSLLFQSDTHLRFFIAIKPNKALLFDKHTSLATCLAIFYSLKTGREWMKFKFLWFNDQKIWCHKIQNRFSAQGNQFDVGKSIWVS